MVLCLGSQERIRLIEVSLSDESTWPEDLLGFLKKNENILRAYEEAEAKLADDDTWGQPYVPMALRPPNPHTDARRRVLEEVECNYADIVSLRGFHCTRLTDAEVEAIRDEGMTPWDSRSLELRIAALVDARLIDRKIAARLANENEAASETRERRIWFIFTPEPLRRESGVNLLFRYWGGEALYGLHIDDSETGPILRSVGTARLIEAVVAVSRLGPHAWPGDVLVRRFLSARGMTLYGLDYENRTMLPVPPENFRRIISRSEATFEALTQCSGWNPPLI